MKEYLVIYEQAEEGGWRAHCADMEVFVIGRTREEAEELVTEGIVRHIESGLWEGRPIPEPRTEAARVAIDTEIATPSP